MYILSNEAMQLLQITTRQGLFKIVKNHNITVKSQGIGLPNLYLKSDLERYMKDNAKNIKTQKNPQVIEKAKKIAKKQNIKKEKHLKIKEEVKKEVNTEIVKEFNIVEEAKEKDIKEIREQKEKEVKEDLELPCQTEIENPLNRVGMAEYERITKLLTEQGTYKDADRSLVLAYAISYQKYIFATVASAKQDDTTIDSFGNLKVHPYFMVAKENFNQMEKMAKLLGIGARSRVGLPIREPKKESVFDILAKDEEF